MVAKKYGIKFQKDQAALGAPSLSAKKLPEVSISVSTNYKKLCKLSIVTSRGFRDLTLEEFVAPFFSHCAKFDGNQGQWSYVGVYIEYSHDLPDKLIFKLRNLNLI